MHKWSDVARVVKSVYELPPEASPSWGHVKHFDGSLRVVSHGLMDGGLTVLRVPSVANRKLIEWWKIPPLPFFVEGFDAYTPDNVLAVAGERGK